MSNRQLLKDGLEKFDIEVTDNILDEFSIYREILVDWNQRMNLTGIE